MIQPEDFLVHKSNTYSQNGEDGIIAAIFRKIGTSTKICCEFGAWDGIHLSNCRSLILAGWSALMIEGDRGRFKDLVSNYTDNPSVICVNKFVSASSDSLGSILKSNNMGDLDLLSIDIDGLDYEIFEMLDVRPRVICIEVNAGHNPTSETRLDRTVAEKGVGQSLQVFNSIADMKGYDFVCYSANAFFVRRDVAREYSLPVLSSEIAYQHFLSHLTVPEKEWLYLVNLGIVNPYFRYTNPCLSRNALGINRIRAIRLMSTQTIYRGLQFASQRLRTLRKAMAGLPALPFKRKI